MTTDVLNEPRCATQDLPYDSVREPVLRSTSSPATITKTASTVLGTPSISGTTTTTPTTTTNSRRMKYSTQTNLSTPRSSASSMHQRHAGPTDILSILRSIALKPFRTASMNEAVAGGHTSNVIGGSTSHNRTPVNLLRYRPLSDALIDQNPYAQSTRAVEDFLKRMAWPVRSTSDEARVKWNTAMKFLIATTFDVNRAIELYRTHENIRKMQNLDHIWINNPHLIRELQSSKLFALPPVSNRPLPIVVTMSSLNHLTSSTSFSSQDREMIAFQAFVCQLDAVTESLEVQQSGINFIYDMQQCSASLCEINLSKRILKLLQSGYPVTVKNIFIIDAAKWIKASPKVSFYTANQIREYLIIQYGYSSDVIPISLGGTFDPALSDNIRYQICLSKVTNPQSICSTYYSSDYQPLTTKNSGNMLYFNPEHDKSVNASRPKGSSSSSSLVAIVSLKSNQETGSLSLTSQSRVHKRESSSSVDLDKRQRSSESLIEEESPVNYRPLLRKEHPTDQSNLNERYDRLQADEQEEPVENIRISMLDSSTRDPKRITIKSPYKLMTETEFLVKTSAEIRQEFRKIPNPPAKDSHAAKEDRNLDKSRYRDVIPGELTRVKLQPDGDDKHDFINANYVTGHDSQEKAYIFTQGPLPSTVRDFWRMIWQENVSVIVMTTNLRESGTLKCHPYWPSDDDEFLDVGSYQIENMKSEKFDSFLITTLRLRRIDQDEIRTVYHAHYRKWPDHGIPVGTKDALLFLEKVEYYRLLTKTTAPILLHCSAGIGRTGTFCAIDMGIKRYLETKTIDVASTVVKMRHERAGSVQTEDQYLFVHLALMDYIKQQQRSTGKSHKPLPIELTHPSPAILRQDSLSSQRRNTSSDSSVSPVQHLPSNENSDPPLSNRHSPTHSQEQKKKGRK